MHVALDLAVAPRLTLTGVCHMRDAQKVWVMLELVGSAVAAYDRLGLEVCWAPGKSPALPPAS